MPAGIPPPPLGTAAFSIVLQIDTIRKVGHTKFGYRRPGVVGVHRGEQARWPRHHPHPRRDHHRAIVGKVIGGGADYQLTGLDARYTLAPDNGEYIVIRNCGPSNALIPVFEAKVDGQYAFLNDIQAFSSSPTMAGAGCRSRSRRRSRGRLRRFPPMAGVGPGWSCGLRCGPFAGWAGRVLFEPRSASGGGGVLLAAACAAG